jgi:hypothetical protein
MECFRLYATLVGIFKEIVAGLKRVRRLIHRRSDALNRSAPPVMPVHEALSRRMSFMNFQTVFKRFESTPNQVKVFRSRNMIADQRLDSSIR